MSTFDSTIGLQAVAAPTAALWTFHDQQLDAWKAWKEGCPTVVVVAGRRWGKTELGCRRMIYGARQDALLLPHQDCLRWIVAPTYKHLRTIWRKMINLSPAHWVHRTVGSEVAPDWIQYRPRSAVAFMTAERPQNLVG